MRRPPDPPFRSAMLAPTWLGDAVMSCALIPLMSELSGGPVSVWARAAHAPLFESLPQVSRALSYDPKDRHRPPLGLWRWRRRVRAAGRPDLVWILPDSFSAALAARAAGAPQRLGRKAEGRSWLLTRTAGKPGDRTRHWIDEHAEWIRAPFGGARDPGMPLSPRIEPGPEAESRARSLLTSAGLDAAACCAFVPGATFGPAKRWTRFAELAERLPAGLTILLLGAEGDRPVLADLARDIARRGRDCVDLCARLDLLPLAALFRALRFTVANDTGPMHLAAAAGGRVLGLFGSTSPRWTAPRGEAARHLAAFAECSPCFQRSCPLPPSEAMICMEQIAPDAVVGALEGWLDKGAA